MADTTADAVVDPVEEPSSVQEDAPVAPPEQDMMSEDRRKSRAERFGVQLKPAVRVWNFCAHWSENACYYIQPCISIVFFRV
jgi:hypothetical protein